MADTIAAVIRVDGADQVMRRLARVAARGRNLRVPLIRAGAVMLKAVDQNFEAEGRPQRWKPRSPLTLAALRAEGMGRARETKRYQGAKRFRTKLNILRQAAGNMAGRKLLQVSGQLRNSMTMLAGSTSVAVGSAHPAARIHQKGGVIRPRTAKALSIPVGNRRVKVLQVRIPARPFLVLTERDERSIVETFLTWLQDGGEGVRLWPG